MNSKKILAMSLLLPICAIAILGGFGLKGALADTLGVSFESYATGSVSGQDGWSNAVNPAYDQEVTASTTGIGSFGTKALRVSDAVTSGSFGDWIFVKPL